MSLKALALLSDGPGAPGGIARYNQAMLSALARDGRVAEITAMVRHGAERWPGESAQVNVVVARSRVRFALGALARAASGRYQLVLCGHLHYVLVAWLAAWLGGARSWLVVHGIEAWRAPGRLVRRAVEHVDGVIAVSRFTARAVRDWACLPLHRVRVLPPTFDAAFAASSARESGARSGPQLLSVSRLDARERYKGHDAVIGCLPRLLECHPDVHYRVVGEGDDRSRLEALARRLGVGARVEFLGAVSDRRLQQIYQEADVFVLPSRGEGFGIVFLEALASGLPVVAGSNDGARDALRDGLLGELVDVTDPDDLIRGIEAALARAPIAPEALACFAPAAFDARVARLVDGLEPAA